MAAVNDGRMFDTPFNVVAGFRTRQQAEAAARRLTSAGLPPASVEVEPQPDAGGSVETAELRAEMQDELSANWAAVTGSQARGALFGLAAFAVAGLAVAAGTPLPPQHGDPRPADPEGYWWKQAGQG